MENLYPAYLGVSRVSLKGVVTVRMFDEGKSRVCVECLKKMALKVFLACYNKIWGEKVDVHH
jgi:hypothetical protein